MSANHKFKVLSEYTHGHIARREQPSQYCFKFKKYFIIFTYFEFYTYYDTLRSLKKSNFKANAYDGYSLVMTVAQDPGWIGFTKDEVIEVIHAMEEAFLMEQVLDSLIQ